RDAAQGVCRTDGHAARLIRKTFYLQLNSISLQNSLFHQPAKSIPGVCGDHAAGVDRPLQIPEAVIFLERRRVEVVTGRGFHTAAIGFGLGTPTDLLDWPTRPVIAVINVIFGIRA